MKFARLILLCLLFSACSPNRQIEQSDQGNTAAASTPAPSNTPSLPTRITVSELINRVVNAKPDAFLYPCDLNSQGEANRAKLRDIRMQWLAKEQDARYLVAPDTGCVCPSICLLAVEDTQTAEPKNFGLLVLEGSPPEKFAWLARNIDLAKATLSWINTTPQVIYKNSDGTQAKICSVELDKKLGRYSTGCIDSNGKKLPGL